MRENTMDQSEHKNIIMVRVMGVFFGKPLNKTFEEPFKANDTPKTVFARLDKQKALGRKFFKSVAKNGQATFLLNGDRMDLSESWDTPLNDGDEISVLSAIAGGCCPACGYRTNPFRGQNGDS